MLKRKREKTDKASQKQKKKVHKAGVCAVIHHALELVHDSLLTSFTQSCWERRPDRASAHVLTHQIQTEEKHC